MPDSSMAARASGFATHVSYVPPSADGEVSRPGNASQSGFQYTDHGDRVLKLTPADILRWTEAARGLRNMCGHFDSPVGLSGALPSELRGSLSHGKNTSEILRQFGTEMTSLLAARTLLHLESFVFGQLVTLSFTYGGLHLAAWRNSFPSNTECMLWKVS